MKLRVTGPKILVEVPKEPTKIGMIFLPKSVAQDHRYILSLGTVLAVGPEAIAMVNLKDGEEPDEEGTTSRNIRVGDKVWFARYGGRGFEYRTKKDHEQGRDVRVLNDEDIMAVIDDEELIKKIDEGGIL